MKELSVSADFETGDVKAGISPLQNRLAITSSGSPINHIPRIRRKRFCS